MDAVHVFDCSNEPYPPSVTDDEEPLSQILTQYSNEGFSCPMPVAIHCKAVDEDNNLIPWLTTGQVCLHLSVVLLSIS